MKKNTNQKKEKKQKKSETSLEEMLREIDEYENGIQPIIFQHVPMIPRMLLPSIFINSDEEEEEKEEEDPGNRPLLVPINPKPQPQHQPQPPKSSRPKHFGGAPKKIIHPNPLPLAPEINLVNGSPLEVLQEKVLVLEKGYEEQGQLLDQQKALVQSLKANYDGHISRTLQTLEEVSVSLTQAQQGRRRINQLQTTIQEVDLALIRLKNSLLAGNSDDVRSKKEDKLKVLFEDGKRCNCQECFICRGNMDEGDHQKDN